ncbi:hypothetical protein SAMN04487911_1426 [Arenibacter nanhaiticus]|uniref:Uncharacterized protein n=1 Tax=Arenibacter nanhaiticus TaxID=558155 RepID=A0A1M6MI24_9FLAO|nr:hypothetical protein [Arenibacter nanhaiticus]SHJ83112.1 hypothetical protein SAMN04487911_1426 [Arenibacter nanhaiticus]
MKICFLIIVIIITNPIFSQIDFDQYKGQESKITINKEYAFVNLYPYYKNASTQDSLITSRIKPSIPEGALTEKYFDDLAKNDTSPSSFSIVLHSKLTIDINLIRHCFIKYKLNKNNEVSDFKVLELILDKNQWKEATETTKETNTIKDIFSYCSVNMLFEFYNQSDNPKFPVINELKTSAKNTNGILDLRILIQVIFENKAALDKYLFL